MIQIETEETVNAMAMPGKRTVEVHVIFLKIGEINTMKECFEADVMVRSKWREPELDYVYGQELAKLDWDTYWNPKMIIENTRGDVKETSSRQVLHEKDGAYVFERRRFRGSFTEPLELWDFPFDTQDLTVTVMSDLPAEDVHLVETPSDVHRIYRQSFIDEQEWYLYKYVSTDRQEIAKDRADPTVKRATLFARCCAARRPAYFVYNMFVVMVILALLAFTTFSVEFKKPQNRLQLGFTLVLTAVAFKFAVTQSLPQISYLTYLDRNVLSTICTVSCVTFWHGIQTLIPDSHWLRPWADLVALGVIAFCYISYNIYFLYRLWSGPYKIRRSMRRRELCYLSRLRMHRMEHMEEETDEDAGSSSVRLKKA